ncbi:Reverse transcriptase (RNA-dependent DNA polymerase) [Rubinisphaera italica]|uniref:Reverse transcriptase (RNA-dependent DNA polymerase) n=1 Tax=Rubinisphaera italica TaxID=2527969 RepID=A0A5C5XCT5_9PLAN|nr:Reverse transcriptase (RNA-dependent DNA polymerase) [Rubinisphaera italica]
MRSYLPRQKGDREICTGQEAFAQRRKKRKRQKLLAKGMITLKLIADHEFLLQCFKELRSEGGWGAGKDGISFASLSPGEWANVFRTLSKTLLKSRYRPLEARKVPIPKPGTSKKRILSIRSICDRVVAKALYTLLEPHMNQLFLNGSWGFRKERGTLQMLEQMKRRIQETGRTVLVIDDVRNAFDRIRVSDLIKSHRKAQKDLAKQGGKSSVEINDSVIKLIAVMAQDTDQSRTIGIDQGNNYSPTALNVLLHYVHDLPITSASHFPFWFRYADNLAYLCQDVPEGHQVRQQVQHLLGKSKLELKGEGGGIFDLQRDTATLLGFGLQIKDNELSFTLTEQAWNNLELQLAESHNALNPSKIALEVITGWVNPK